MKKKEISVVKTPPDEVEKEKTTPAKADPVEKPLLKTVSISREILPRKKNGRKERQKTATRKTSQKTQTEPQKRQTRPKKAQAEPAEFEVLQPEETKPKPKTRTRQTKAKETEVTIPQPGFPEPKQLPQTQPEGWSPNMEQMRNDPPEVQRLQEEEPTPSAEPIILEFPRGGHATAKKILFVGSEAMPFAATGGLGDVLGSLPASLAATGRVDVRVVIPLYGSIPDDWRRQMKLETVTTVRLAWREQYCGIFSLQKDGVTFYFIDNEYYFKRPSLYGQYDDGERYAFFCMAVPELMRHVDFYPDVLHAHDWQAALSLVYLNCLYRSRPGYGGIRTVFTIHNIEYQGQYDFAILGDVFSLGEQEHSLMEYGGCINLMKAAIECADRVTTVSPRYARELRTDEYSHGLRAALDRNGWKLRGILNGIDYAYYNPADDPDIAAAFSIGNMAGKAEDKKAFQREVGLPEREDVPLLAVVSRLAAHKGVDLISQCICDIVGGREVQLAVLGKGEERYENFFRELQGRYPDRVRALITYDRALSKRIYAAADIFLMPSRSEPCGLSQMIASRYGAIPVVRETGGLYDSIKPYWMEGEEMRGNGFTFANYAADELRERTNAAIELWYQTGLREKLVTRIMRTDFSWNASAQKYLELYAEL